MTTYTYHKDQVALQEAKLARLKVELEYTQVGIPTEEQVQEEEGSSKTFFTLRSKRENALRKCEVLESRIASAEKSLEGKKERFQKVSGTVLLDVRTQISALELLEKSTVDSYWLGMIRESIEVGDGIHALRDDMEGVLVYLNKLCKLSDKMTKEFGSVSKGLKVLRDAEIDVLMEGLGL